MTGKSGPGPKPAHPTLIGVPPPPPRRGSLPNISAVAPPPPPVRRTHPSLPAVLVPPSEPRPLPARPADLAFSRTVLASEVGVPPELQAAVLVPAAPEPNPIVPSAPNATAEPSVAPAESPAKPVSAASPYGATPVEETPAIAAAALDVGGTAVRPRPRLRTGAVLAVTAVAVVTGFGLTLLIGRTAGQDPATVAAARPTPVTPASAAIARGPTSTEPVAKAGAIERAPVRETAGAVIAERASEPQVPVASATVPGCREMLGDAFVEKADPNAALAETQVGNRELVRGKVDLSQAAYCKAALWDGAKVERWLNLAQIFLIRRDGTKAVEASGRALELDPKNARALELQGDAFARLGRLKEARIAYLAAEARAEPDEDALKWLVRRDLDEANRSLKSREFVRAERLFRRVVVFDPQHAGAALGVATCLRKQYDQKAADDWEHHAETLVRNKNR